MGAVFAVLIGINAYVFFFRGGTSVRALLQKTSATALAPSAAPSVSREGASVGARAGTVTETKPLPPDPKAKAVPAPLEEDDGRLLEATLRDQETLLAALTRLGLSERDRLEVSRALANAGDLPPAHEGQAITVRFDCEEQPRLIEQRLSGSLGLRLERIPPTAKLPAAWRVVREERASETRVVEVGGTVGWSLADAFKRAGEGLVLAQAFASVFASEMNFWTDSQAGDRFRALVEKRYVGGKFVRYGRIVAAEYQQQRSGTVLRAFWFEPRGGERPGAYYTQHGENLDRQLLRGPIKFTKGTAGLDRRRLGPVPVVERGQAQYEFSGPPAASVWAMAEGKVTAVSTKGGPGLSVTVQHDGGLETTYSHLGALAHGIAVGQQVRARQLLGAVGAFGPQFTPAVRVTARLGHQPLDLQRWRAPRLTPLDERLRNEFADAVAPRLAALAAVTLRAPDRLGTRLSSATP
jgi:murein DD-endopeptidase MepM/ murein hydrolase activator NlpD